MEKGGQGLSYTGAKVLWSFHSNICVTDTPTVARGSSVNEATKNDVVIFAMDMFYDALPVYFVHQSVTRGWCTNGLEHAGSHGHPSPGFAISLNLSTSCFCIGSACRFPLR